jgi:hypothetical protein
MSRHVAKISVCFQVFPKTAGSPTPYGRDMEGAPISLINRNHLRVNLTWGQSIVIDVSPISSASVDGESRITSRLAVAAAVLFSIRP